MPKSKQVDVMMCAGCGVTLTPRETYHDDEARMLCLGCYDAWYEATFCEECGYKWDECTCGDYEYEKHEDAGDLYPDEVEEEYEVEDICGDCGYPINDCRCNGDGTFYEPEHAW